MNNLTAKEKPKTKQASNTGLKNRAKTDKVSDLKKILKGMYKQKKPDNTRTSLSILNCTSSLERIKNRTVKTKAGKRASCKRFKEKFLKRLAG